MKKKRLWITLSVITILSLLALPITIGVNAFLLPTVFDVTFLGEMKEKIKKLKETDGKRILLIGGSSLPFGVDSKLLEENLNGYQIIDFGMYASLGSNVMLDFAKARINQDDIVIFMPEQNRQTLSMYYNGTSLWQALDGDFGSRKYLPSSTKERMVGDLYAFSQSKFKYTFQEKLDLGDTIYKKESFNEYLDIDSALTPYNTMRLGYDETTPISFKKDNITSDFISYVNDFAKYVRSKGANLYYHFGPSNTLAVKDKEDIDDYYSYLKEQFDFDMMGDPHNSIMDAGWFYDSNFHLNGAGKTMFTKQLVKDIKLLLNDPSQTEISDVDMPESPDHINMKDGDNADHDCFGYQLLDDDTYQITSLKEEKENIIVPYRYQGKLVSGFDKKVFQNHTGIKEITIQDNVSAIMDNSFSGCTSLEKIHLLHTKPSQLHIGTALLDGTNADLYVSKDSYSSFVMDYNFAHYGTRIHGE